jgi:hypothetical protein
VNGLLNRPFLFLPEVQEDLAFWPFHPLGYVWPLENTMMVPRVVPRRESFARGESIAPLRFTKDS